MKKILERSQSFWLFLSDEHTANQALERPSLVVIGWGGNQVKAGRMTFASLYGKEGISRPRSGHDDCVGGLDLASLLRAILGDGPYPSLPKALVTSKAICKAKVRSSRIW